MMRNQSRFRDPITDFVPPRRELLVGNDGLIEAVKPACFVSVSHHHGESAPSRTYLFYQTQAGTRQEKRRLLRSWRLVVRSVGTHPAISQHGCSGRLA